MTRPKHVIGISGGKDSAALAIYLHKRHPELDPIYYFCDTGKELDETYQLIENLEIYLGKKVAHLKSEDAAKANENPFDYYYKAYRGYLPSSVARWCTKQMKLDPFEKFVGDDPVISYVGIRGDEDREGYISKKTNIQSIFPFRRNIWSEDVVRKLLANGNRDGLKEIYRQHLSGGELDRVVGIIDKELSLEPRNPPQNRRAFLEKQNQLLDRGTALFNHVTFDWLKETSYPLATEADFPLLDNEDNLNRADIFKLLEDSGVGVPAYYNKLEYEVDGEKGEYARSRSGCFFCFFQQKIEWIWLYEQHPDLFKQAQHYEKIDEGFTWNQNESLVDLVQPERIRSIKREHLNRANRKKSKASNYLIDVLDDTEENSCISCFV
jgi:3'-phosphoadenosine 5'-phosphosulfate sulfotransferase (PAPS reductase)/FAD synthetase